MLRSSDGLNVPRKKSPCTLRERKSKFVEIFRTTPVNTVCPNFFVLSHANGCTFRPQCNYCYLKSSFWYLSEQQAFSNTDKILREVKAWIAQDELESYVLNSGNLSDSLVFEEERPLIPQLVELFRSEAEAKGRRHALLVVTKGGARECRGLQSLQPCRNVIVSFSVNAPEAARRHEAGAAEIADRLEAARRLKQAGWRLRIRIDPMILGFDYTWLLEQVAELAPERVTLGMLRAEANLPRFTQEGLFKDLEPASDGRSLSRYSRPARMALYGQAVEALRKVCPIGLCEETPDVWTELGLEVETKSCNCNS